VQVDTLFAQRVALIFNCVHNVESRMDPKRFETGHWNKFWISKLSNVSIKTKDVKYHLNDKRSCSMQKAVHLSNDIL